jgi:hypothetical protein
MSRSLRNKRRLIQEQSAKLALSAGKLYQCLRTSLIVNVPPVSRINADQYKNTVRNQRYLRESFILIKAAYMGIGRPISNHYITKVVFYLLFNHYF